MATLAHVHGRLAICGYIGVGARSDLAAQTATDDEEQDDGLYCGGCTPVLLCRAACLDGFSLLGGLILDGPSRLVG